MSYVEHPEEFTNKWTEKERYEFIEKYKTMDKTVQISNIDNWFPNQQDSLVKKCCDNCDYCNESEYCSKDVSNVYCENYLESTNTFYCSYHKFKDNI